LHETRLYLMQSAKAQLRGRFRLSLYPTARQCLRFYQMANGLSKGGITPETLAQLGIAEFEGDITS